MTERRLRKRLKKLCAICSFDESGQYKLHSFRHHFASLCANHNVAHRKGLAWLGHSSSQMLDLYYHLHDEDSQHAMMELAGVDESENTRSLRVGFEGNRGVNNRESRTSSRAEATCAMPHRRIGEGGIRTPATVARRPHFECGSFSHSDTSPRIMNCELRIQNDAALSTQRSSVRFAVGNTDR